MTTAGVLLAAGAGSRFASDTHKLLARIGDRTVFEHALETVLAAGFDQVVVVTGAVDLDELLVGRPVERVVNERWADGIATSVQAGVTVAQAAGCDAVVVGLADQPGITADAWRAVASADATPIAVATYDGRRGNPVRLAAEAWPLLPTDGDEGARVLMRDHPDLVTEVPCSGTAFDIDTTDDLRQLGGTP
ncbi:MAG: nucleotidyltransferase family protein [Acidimicrobiia bacterium]|nr:nucleotidyltransferase family protein [Acidimicrobiia bacterium]